VAAEPDIGFMKAPDDAPFGLVGEFRLDSPLTYLLTVVSLSTTGAASGHS
jgi:hypothetical protein